MKLVHGAIGAAELFASKMFSIAKVEATKAYSEFTVVVMRPKQICQAMLVFVVLFLASFSTLALADDKIQIVVETEILSPDPQAGIKSRHVIQVDFGALKIRDAYQTGVTDFFGVDLTSIRDNFKVSTSKFSANAVNLTLSGETASGVGIIPNINYRFEIALKADGTASISGCHDGYPAYRVIVEGKKVYSFVHQSKDLIKLFGTCDVKVNQ